MYVYYFGSNTENFNDVCWVCVLIEIVLLFVFFSLYFLQSGRKEGLGECGLKSDCQRSLNIEPHFLC